MKKRLILLACVGVSVATGIGLAWKSDQPESAPEKSTVKITQAVPQAVTQQPTLTQFSSLWGKGGVEPPVAPEKSAIINDLWARALTPSEKLKVGDDAQDKLRKMAQADPEVMKNLLGRYGRETDPNAKEVLRSLLATIEKPEILAFSKELATSGDATQRKDGLAMLQNLSADSQEVRNIIKQTLATEQTASVLVQALAALKPNAPNSTAAVDPAEADAIVSQLKNLTQNADAGVRGQSLLQLAQWDKSGAAQSNLSQALTDQAPEVRQAAIFAIAQSGVQSDSAKAALLAMIGNVNESKDVRGSALQALERFTLNKEEAAKYSQIRSQVLGM